MRINYNISAIIANNALNKNDNRLNVSSERLSSGYKINHAKDDPSGIAIGKKMRAQIRAIEQASQNANDAISIVETADGALSSLHDILQRMNELAIKAGTSTATDDDRKLINEEIQQLKEEIERVGRDTDFNAQKLLDGTFDRKGYSQNPSAKVLYFSDEVPSGDYTISFTVGMVGTELGVTDAQLVSTTAVGAESFMTGALLRTEENTFTFHDQMGKEVKISVDAETLGAGTQTVHFDLTDIGPMRVQIGANEGQVLAIRIPKVSLENMGIHKTNALTQADAQKAIEEVAEGISYISEVRSRLGAYQNRLEHTTSNQDITQEELTGAYSRIMDVDMSEEMTEYTNLQVLVQAGTSILAQTNQRPQQVLQLLQ